MSRSAEAMYRVSVLYIFRGVHFIYRGESPTVSSSYPRELQA